MFIPEIASKCARFESRNAFTVSSEIPDLSPVITPLEKAPASPGTAAMIALESRVRSRLISWVPSSGSCHSITGERVYPTAPN